MRGAALARYYPARHGGCPPCSGRRSGAALSLYGEALPIARALTEIDATAVRPFALQHEILFRMAGARQRAGDLDGALASFEEEVGALRAALALRPDDPSYRGDLAVVLVRSGALRALAPGREDGLATMAEGVAIFRELAKGGGPGLRRDLATALGLYVQVAAFQAKVRRPEPPSAKRSMCGAHFCRKELQLIGSSSPPRLSRWLGWWTSPSRFSGRGRRPRPAKRRGVDARGTHDAGGARAPSREPPSP